MTTVIEDRVHSVMFTDLSNLSLDAIIPFLLIEDLLNLLLTERSISEKLLMSSVFVKSCVSNYFHSNLEDYLCNDIFSRLGNYSLWCKPKFIPFINWKIEFPLQQRRIQVVISKQSFPQIPSLFPYPQVISNSVNLDTEKNSAMYSSAHQYFDCLPPFASSTINYGATQQLQLTCISYFEVQFSTNPKSNPLSPLPSYDYQTNPQHCCLGLTYSHQDLEEINKYVEGNILRQSNSSAIDFHKTLAFDSFHRFQPEDIMGCGIVYPPLSANPYGQVIFSRNGRLVHVEDFKSSESIGITWYPFAMTSDAIIATFNFGREIPWKFDLLSYEQERVIERKNSLRLQNQSFYSWTINEQRRLLGIRPFLLDLKLFYRLVRKLQQLEQPQPEAIPMHCLSFFENPPLQSYPMDANTPVLIIGNLANESTRRSSSNLTSPEPNSEEIFSTVKSSSLPSVLKSGIFYRTSSFDETSTREKGGKGNTNSVVFNESCNQSIQVFPITEVPYHHNSDNNNNTAQSSLPPPPLPAATSFSSMVMEDDLDWCEDSMAVELSSVDSMAVNEMRDCGISTKESVQIGSSDNQTLSNTQENAATKYPNQIKLYLRSTNQFNSHYHQELLDSVSGDPKQTPIQTNTNSQASRSSPFSPSSHSNLVTVGMIDDSSSKYTGLADAKSASDWLKRANEMTAISHHTPIHTPMKSDISSSSKMNFLETSGVKSEDVDGNNSEERSVATSLFVEVDSVDEDGSYLGYGAACEEQENECDDEEYIIQGRLSKTEDTQLFHDSHDSDSGQCGARWTSDSLNTITSRHPLADLPVPRESGCVDPSLFQRPEAPFQYIPPYSTSPATSLPRRKRKLVEAIFPIPSNTSTPTPRASPQLKYARKSLRLNSRKFFRSSQSPTNQYTATHKPNHDYYSGTNPSSSNTIQSLPSLSLIASSVDIPRMLATNIDGEDGYDGASERGRCENDILDDCITDNEFSRNNYDAIEKEEISFAGVNTTLDLDPSESNNHPLFTVSPDGSERKEYGSVRTPSSMSTLDPTMTGSRILVDDMVDPINNPPNSGESSISSCLIPPHHRLPHRLRKSHSRSSKPPA